MYEQRALHNITDDIQNLRLCHQTPSPSGLSLSSFFFVLATATALFVARANNNNSQNSSKTFDDGVVFKMKTSDSKSSFARCASTLLVIRIFNKTHFWTSISEICYWDGLLNVVGRLLASRGFMGASTSLATNYFKIVHNISFAIDTM